MGYELNRIMKQYGVSTPGMAPYTGAPEPSTTVNIVKPTDVEGLYKTVLRREADPSGLKFYKERFGDTVEDEEYKAFLEEAQNEMQKSNLTAPVFGEQKISPTAFKEQMDKYELDRKPYDAYKTTYQNRLQNTPMYAQSQFQNYATIPAAQTGQPDLSGNTLTPDIATNLMHRSMTTGAPTSEFDRYGGYDKVKAFYDVGGGSYAKPTLLTQQILPTKPVANTVADLYKMYLEREPEAGIPGSAPASTRPNFINEAQAELLYRNLGNQNLMNATGSYYGNQLKNPIYAAKGGYIHGFAGEYAHGGPVKTHYQTAGAVKLPSGYGSVEEEKDFKNRFFTPSPEVVSNPIEMGNIPAAVTNDLPVVVTAPKSILTEIAVNNAKNVSEPVAVAPVAPVAPKAAVPFGGERMGNIQALLDAYGPKDSAYAADLTAARKSAKDESDAFAKMLIKAMSSPEDAQSSKAEIYFRLASAFGAPTKTGQFSENLSMVGKELGEYAKNKRTSAKEKLALTLEAQKLKMTTAKEDLKSLQALAGEEMKDKRTIATELIKEYIKSGEPQSAAGKQARDEGLTPGTEAYQNRVEVIGNMNIEARLAQINSSLANVGTAQANLALNQEKFKNQQDQQTKLTPAELKLKTEAEAIIASSKQSLVDLKRAYALNPNSLAGGWLDKSQQFLSEAAGSEDPTIVNTRVLNNLLGAQGLAKLRATFGGNPAEGEREILLELEGIGSKTKEERGKIIKRAYKVLKDRLAQEQARLDQINSGAYRTTTPLEGEIE